MELKNFPGFSWDLLLWRWVMHMLNSLFSTMNKHAVAIKDGKVKDIDNALVITTGNEDVQGIRCRRG